jgi:preprotein translocase subunit SecG
MNTHTILSIVTITSAVLMVAAVLLQARGASLGAGFGSSGELFTTRRGTDKSLFEATIVLAVVFVGSLLVGLLIG